MHFLDGPVAHSIPNALFYQAPFPYCIQWDNHSLNGGVEGERPPGSKENGGSKIATLDYNVPENRQ